MTHEDPKLNELKNLVNTMREETNDPLETLKGLEQKLADMDLDVAFWHDLALVPSHPYSPEVGWEESRWEPFDVSLWGFSEARLRFFSPEKVERKKVRCRTSYEIGYAAIEGKFRICIRLVEKEEGPGHDEWNFYVHIKGPVPIECAASFVQKEAANHLDEFLDRLFRHTWNYHELISEMETPSAERNWKVAIGDKGSLPYFYASSIRDVLLTIEVGMYLCCGGGDPNDLEIRKLDGTLVTTSGRELARAIEDSPEFYGLRSQTRVVGVDGDCAGRVTYTERSEDPEEAERKVAAGFFDVILARYYLSIGLLEAHFNDNRDWLEDDELIEPSLRVG